MSLSTPLYPCHLAERATFVDFGGWRMPLHYGSQTEEHLAVRRSAGLFDVSHMGILDLEGARVRELLSLLLANDVAKLREPGDALYSCMLLPNGGVIDDLIVYALRHERFRLVVNAATCAKDLAWILEHAARFAVEVTRRTDLAMLAVQGPQGRAHAVALLPAAAQPEALALRPFCGAQWGDWFLARTGYTGEDGVEIILPGNQAESLWTALRERGVVPVGLGARDTLRLEAGMSLYGHELDEQHHPLESGLAWSVQFAPPERDFHGRQVLERARAGGCDRLVGLLLEGRGVLRRGQSIAVDAPVDGTALVAGTLTSGSFSPTLKRSIGLARVPRGVGERVWVDIRGTYQPARVVKPPFVRHGAVRIPLHTAETVG